MAKSQYIGSKKIFALTPEEITTPSGDKVLRVQFEDGSYELMPEKAIKVFATTKPIDPTSLREIRGNVITTALLEALLEYNVSVGDMDYYLTRLSKRFSDAMDRAINYLWREDDSQFVSGSNPMGTATLLDAEKIIKSIGEDGETKEGADS